MAFSPPKLPLFLFTLFSLLFFSRAKLSIDPSDYRALSIILKDLDISDSQRLISTNPCNTAGVFCERRLSKNNTYILKITRLLFNSKGLTGFVSPSIGRLSELKQLSLANNSLVDQLPPQIVDCKKLETLDIQNNQFSGKIPANLSSLIRLRVLDLSGNKFSGNLNFLKYFPNLEYLSVANNLFSGKIPPSIRSFRNLQHFDFSGNNFLDGPVPVISKTGSSSIQYPKRYILAERSPALAPAPDSKKNDSSAQVPSPSPSTPKHKKNSKRKLSGWILGFLAGALAGTISGFVFSVLFKLILAAIKGGGRDSGPAIYSPLIKKAEDLAFLEKDDGLASLEIIGSGGCGQVFKAELPGSNGKMIAIKKVIQPPKDAAELTDEDSKLLNKKMRQIRSEINTVGQIRHRNLLPLLAHISRPDCHLLVAIDSKLLGNGFEEQMLLILKIACFCTVDNPKDRPNSKDVRCMLSQIKKN
ncbi:hypothetical protein Patl1_18190 [Pistacia atlantica]|uniref:Uncharacterized protein n=1 Tax=Pistacia atlantica TaxID=434234 RepID=A0ACC1BXQ0_9ROSI|nr:hypothetical protein Patl1_18190 [Pistacia atlantica]